MFDCFKLKFQYKSLLLKILIYVFINIVEFIIILKCSIGHGKEKENIIFNIILWQTDKIHKHWKGQAHK